MNLDVVRQLEWLDFRGDCFIGGVILKKRELYQYFLSIRDVRRFGAMIGRTICDRNLCGNRRGGPQSNIGSQILAVDVCRPGAIHKSVRVRDRTERPRSVIQYSDV